MGGNASGGRVPTPARLLIVDDHELARAGLRSILSGHADLTVAGEASTAAEAVELCELLRPDLVLMDVRMPGQDGLAATEAIRATCPQTSVVILTIHEDPDYLYRALKAGAAGYLLKDATRREIVDAVRRVLRGESILNPELAGRLLRRLAGAEPDAPALPAVEAPTPRELDVLRLLARGMTNQEIAAGLGIGAGTVKAHVQRIIAKLGAADRTQAAVRAVQLGLIAPSDMP